LDIINDTSLEQFVFHPTRNENILDLIFTSFPIVSQLSVVPGMSDHEAVLFSVNVKARILQSILFSYIIRAILMPSEKTCQIFAIPLCHLTLLLEPWKRTGNFSRHVYKIVLPNMCHKKQLKIRIDYLGLIMILDVV